jgi:hypothetical protein
MNSLNAPVSAPTASILTSAACALAAGTNTRRKKAVAAIRKILIMDVTPGFEPHSKYVFASMLSEIILTITGSG